MGRRLRMPIGGARLLDQRRAGVHPYQVHVLVGGPVRETVRGEPALWVGERWRPGETDWTMAAGVPVNVWCLWPFRASEADAEVPHPIGIFGLAAMAGELARLAAPVWVYLQDQSWADCGRAWVRCEYPADDLASELRRLHGDWPRPWSPLLCEDYARRAAVWLKAPIEAAA